jgi:hypothetical protein
MIGVEKQGNSIAAILDASFLGLAGDEVIHCVLDIMYAKAPYTVIQRAFRP